jgi:hypothetical protein
MHDCSETIRSARRRDVASAYDDVVVEASLRIGDEHNEPVRERRRQVTKGEQRVGKTEPVVIHHGRGEQADRKRPGQPRQTATGPRSPRLE